MASYRIIFDGPPGPQGPGFVEVENDEGKSINAGTWLERPDGFFELVLPLHDIPVTTEKAGVTVNELVWTNCSSLSGRKLLAFDTFGNECGRIDLHAGVHVDVVALKAAFQLDYDKRVLEAITVRPPVANKNPELSKAIVEIVTEHIATQKEVCLLELSVGALQEELKRQKRISKQRMQLLQAARAKIQFLKQDVVSLSRDAIATRR